MSIWKAVVSLLGLWLSAAQVAAEEPGGEVKAEESEQAVSQQDAQQPQAVAPQGVPPAASVAPVAPVAPAAPAGSRPPPAPAGDVPAPDAEVTLDEITVTVTREARPSRDVPQAVAVIGKERLADVIPFNVKDAVVGTPGVLIDSKNGGYDARLLIRGAGLKAPYGVREIQVLRDGVPLTDPDSLTRLDWIDTQDIERIEIAKGPGNLYSPGNAGGAVQIISRSVFDRGANVARAALGSYGAGNLHLRTSGALGESNALALTASYRTQENQWRLWNRFDTRQVSLKHGVSLGLEGALESEVSYTEANMQLPGAMNAQLYQQFKETGEQLATSEPWRNMGRYSKILFLNTRLEREAGPFTLKPRLYYNQWTHRHPVTGSINETGNWTRVVGTDLEARHRHGMGPVAGTLVFGVTAKGQWNDDIRRYQYRDVQVTNGRITATLSDAEGPLMETERQWNVLGGVFVQESLRWDRFLLDLGGRIDRSRLRVSSDELTAYDWTAGNYVPGAGHTVTDRTFDLPAPKAGLTVRLTDAVSGWASAAQAFQVPAESEILANPGLKPSRLTSYEAGVKVRSARFSVDASAFYTRVRDEIVSFVDTGYTVFQNAGATDKRGLEIAAGVRILPWLEAGGSYAYSDFEYVRFLERAATGTADRSGSLLPFVPRHQYSVFAAVRHPSGLRVRAQSNTWGRYQIDNANSATYPGYAWLTSLSAAWQAGSHEVVLEIENLLDQRYAMQVVKDTNGRVSYVAGAPRVVMFGYAYHL